MGIRLIYNLDNTILMDQVPDIDFTQSSDIMWLAHVDRPLQRLERYGHASWLIRDAIIGTTAPRPSPVPTVAVTSAQSTTDFFPAPRTYVVTATRASDGQESIPSLPVTISNDLQLKGNFNTISWTPVVGAESYTIYQRKDGIDGLLGTAKTASFVDDNIGADYLEGPPQGLNPISAVNKYPGKVTLHEQRLVVARTKTKPNLIHMSRTADLQNFDRSKPIRASDSIELTLTARQVNEVQHLLPLKGLLVLTGGGIFSIKGEPYIGPSTLKVTPEGYRGANPTRPVLLDDMAFFFSAKGGGVRTLGYEFEADGYRGSDLTVFAPHFFEGYDIVDAAFVEYPQRSLFMVRNDGAMVVMLWEREQQVWGMSLITTDGLFEQACAITEGGVDALYVVVRRLVKGNWRRFVERMANNTSWETEDDSCHLDSSRSYAGPPIKIVGGLHHLEGRTVSAVADGAALTGLMVSNGLVNLPRPASRIRIGLPYEGWITTLPSVVEGSRGRAAQIKDLVVGMERTRGVEFAASRPLTYGETVPRSAADEAVEFFEPPLLLQPAPLNKAVKPFTGSVQAELPATDWREQGIVIRQRHPLPATILGVYPDVVYGNK